MPQMLNWLAAVGQRVVGGKGRTCCCFRWLLLLAGCCFWLAGGAAAAGWLLLLLAGWLVVLLLLVGCCFWLAGAAAAASDSLPFLKSAPLTCPLHLQASTMTADTGMLPPAPLCAAAPPAVAAPAAPRQPPRWPRCPRRRRWRRCVRRPTGVRQARGRGSGGHAASRATCPPTLRTMPLMWMTWMQRWLRLSCGRRTRMRRSGSGG